MSNSYFDWPARLPTNRFVSFDTVRAEDVNNALDLISSAFEKLPSPLSIWGATSAYAEASGTVNAWVVSIAPTYITSHVDGLTIRVKLPAANTIAAPTLNLNGMGAKTIVTEADGPVGVNDIQADMIVTLIYNADYGKWQMTQTAIASSAAAAASASSAADSAGAAAGSAGSASFSASAAAGSASDALTYSQNAEASRDAIDNRIYPGSYSSAPTVRPDATAMQEGDQYLGTDGYTYARIAGVWVNQTSAAAISAAAADSRAVDAEEARDAANTAVASIPDNSSTVMALRLGRESSAGNAEVSARVTRFEQPIAVTPSVTTRWRGVVRANGRHFHVPFDATTVLIHNPDTGEAYQTNFGLDLTGTNKWSGAVVGRDGRIYCVPQSAQTVLVIDPVAMTASLETFGLPTTALSSTFKWDGGALAADGNIYFAPSNATTLLVIDTMNQTARALTATQLGLAASALNGSSKYSGMVSVGNRVYAIPFVATNVLLVDVLAGTATQPNYGLTLSDSSKWSRAVVFGALIYCVPFSATDILVIDTTAQTAVRTAMGADLTGTNKWRAIVAVGRKLYGIPGESTSFLVIDPLDTTGSAQGTAMQATFNVYDVRAPATTGTLLASPKWAGAVVHKGVIYGCPSGSVQAGQDILILDPAANAGVGQAHHTDLRAYIASGAGGATKWFGGVAHPNGYVYATPASAQDFLIIRDDDPANDYPVAVRHSLGVVLGATDQKFQGGALGGDSCIYLFPRSTETRVCKIDPGNLTASPYGTATLTDYGGARDRETLAVNQPLGVGGVDEQKWHSNVTGMDGKIYGVPYNATKVLILDPFAVDAQKLELTNFGLNLNGGDKWVGGCLHPNGKIYCAPRAASTSLVIDTNPASPTYNQAWLTNFGVDLNASSGTASTFLKWSYPNLGADGRLYFMPRAATNVLVVDPSDTSMSPHGKATFETFGIDMSTLNGYTIAAKSGPDGRIYAAATGAPTAGTGNFLVIDTITRKAQWQDYGLAAALNSDNKFAGCVQTLTGRLIFIPRSFSGAVVLKLKNVPPLPAAAVLGPYLNKC